MKMSQRELADHVGVSPAAVCQWETGKNPPSQDSLDSVVKAFGLTMQRFYGPVPAKRAKGAA